MMGCNGRKSAQRIPREAEKRKYKPMNCPSPSFADLYHAHFDFAWRCLRRLGVETADLDDATQEIFVILLRKQVELDPTRPLRPWLYGVVRRIAWRYRRGEARRARLHAAVDVAPELSTRGANPRATVDPDETYDRREAARLLDHFLETLTPTQREVFVLAELEQLSGGEIAALLEVNQNTIWSRLRSARQAFDRSFRALRAEHQRLHESPKRTPARQVLSLSRHAHQPTHEDRRRIGARLGIPLAPLGLPNPGNPTPDIDASPLAPPKLAPLALASPLRAALMSLAVAGATIGLVHIGASTLSPAPAPNSSDSLAIAEPLMHAEPLAAVGASGSGPTLNQRANSRFSPVAREQNANNKTRDPSPKASPRTAKISGETRPGKPTRKPRGNPPKRPTTAAASRKKLVSKDTSNSQTPSATDLNAELDLIAASRNALTSGQARHALGLAQEHARRFPTGALANEREGLRISSLCELGRDREAIERADALRRRVPDPDAVRRFMTACTGGKIHNESRAQTITPSHSQGLKRR